MRSFNARTSNRSSRGRKRPSKKEIRNRAHRAEEALKQEEQMKSLALMGAQPLLEAPPRTKRQQRKDRKLAQLAKRAAGK